MKIALATIAIFVAAVQLANAAGSPGPIATSPITPIAAPKDQAYPGEIQLTVDASDNGRRIVRVHERVSAVGPDTVLLHPRWLPGWHAPGGPIDRLAGISISANGASVSWTRDPSRPPRLDDILAARP